LICQVSLMKQTMRGAWNHNIHYHTLVLRSIPPGCRRALDVGCGRGLLALELASRCQEVIAIDNDHEALSWAMTNGSSQPGITFVEDDVMTHRFAPGNFDFIAAVATLHHLPLRPALARFRDLLKPSGVLAIIGLYRGETLVDLAQAAAAFPASWMLRCMRGCSDVGAPVKNPAETLREIRIACNDLLPGAAIRRHLLFRYSLVWRKP
jgi:2-polyprenyl-3-methyl-5-hydroxy-6-metoxy-1,4-benzoquinol methylase